MTHVQNIFAELFDSLRGTGSISTVVNVSGYPYEITTDNTDFLAAGDVVAISDTDGFTGAGYSVTSVVSETSFQITAKNVGTLGAVGTWKNKSWYFYPAFSQELSNRVLKESQVATIAVTPAGWLVEGFDIDMTDVRFDYVINSLTLVLFNNTQRELYTQERYDGNYSQIIDPFYDRLIAAMQEHKNLFEPRDGFDISVTYNPLYNEKQTSIIADAKIITFNNLQIFNTNCNG